MLSIYWAALGLGGVFVVLTTLMGADHDSGDGDGGGDFHGDLHGDLHGDFSSDVGDDVGHIDSGHSDGHSIDGPGVLDILFLMISIRFWSFFIAFFGLTGVGLTYTNGAGLTTLIIAIVMGLFAGYGVSYLFRFMNRANVSTDVGYGDMIGHTGKVLIPVAKDKRGKVRLIIKGNIIDMPSFSFADEFNVDDQVVVVDIKNNNLIISKPRNHNSDDKSDKGDL